MKNVATVAFLVIVGVTLAGCGAKTTSNEETATANTPPPPPTINANATTAP